MLSSLPLLLLGLFTFGASTACGLQARYAAADLAEPERRGRSLSLVVWATTIGSVLGPNLAGPGPTSAGGCDIPPLDGGFVVSLAAFADRGGRLPGADAARPAAALPPPRRRVGRTGGAPAAGHAAALRRRVARARRAGWG